ncbi:formylglycine-generating enzyme family protein [Pseudoalteromonas sp. S16_S37]|uniref:formylglycine-generating enzyme family protein n=1 Tax=Pseudoalteromonas sp. S16_S37 TaxID=2720228 RepID=UPI0016806082|nr:SUMF1/EgtB/PvdO family nonheme iron enzyme [Pseudoalteromonas sp. S16_S37]MBD1584120.1 SUMF1/EgtB/PvdO family nonheme iron enzyme [Pseudoalteromonas sp. S16_S37]
MKYAFSTLLLCMCTTLSAKSAVIEPILQLVPGSEAQELPSFYMSKYEITVAQFSQFVRETDYQVPQNCMAFTDELWPDPEKPGRWDLPALIENPYRPVVCTGVQGALDYAKWLSEKTGKHYQLPSVQQWRHAALAGQTGRMAFADDFDKSEICDYENTEDIANIAGMKKHHQVRYKRSANCNDGAIYHTVVGMYRANQFGLYDMMGNTRELTRTCHRRGEKDPSVCEQYVVVGEAWHWQPRGTLTPDWMDTDFQGSIEGFRLVLETDIVEPMSVATKEFAKKLKAAQFEQHKVHAKNKTIPSTPEGVRLRALSNNNIKVSWLDVKGQGVKYAIYRELADLSSAKVTRFVKLADDITTSEFIDSTLPDKAFARYQVFSYNEIGEGLGSKIVTYGQPWQFSTHDRIEAEHFFAGRYHWIRERDAATVVGFNENPDHFPTGIKPHKPAWIKLAFNVSKEQQVKLKFRARAEQGGQFELWQGTHLVGRYEFPQGDEFTIHSAHASLIASNEPLELRMGNSFWFELDWLEFK